MLRFSQRIWLIAFLVAWSVDYLFWGKPAGVSFLVFVLVALAGGFLLAWLERTRPALVSVFLSIAVVSMAAMTLVRAEPFSRFINGMLALAGLALLVRTFQTGGWVRFGIFSYLAMWIDLFLVALSRAAGLPLIEKEEKQSAFRTGLRSAVPWLRGLLLALPLVILLAALLASADLVFADQMDAFLQNFDLARLPEYLLRLFFILVMSYLFAGLFRQAVKPVRWVFRLPGDEMIFTIPDPAPESSPAAETRSEPSVSRPGSFASLRFLGLTEAFIVLGSINLLFAFFTAIQFRYLFGGGANITEAGYTYSEYARRGFFELVSVAIISLLIYLALNGITRRGTVGVNRVFTLLSALMVGQVLVILVSAFQRLLLYENAYGFTRLRTYTHVFIPWLALLLAATIVLQVLHLDQYFGAVLLAVMLGFALSFGGLNIDGLIVRQNVTRAQAGLELDGAYLLSLSDDSLPELVRSFTGERIPSDVRDQLGGVLACRIYHDSISQPQPWQSYHPGRAASRRSLAGLDLSGYPVKDTADGIFAQLPGGDFSCYPTPVFD